MKKIIFLIFVFCNLLYNCQTEKSVSKYPYQVGDIEYDAKLDDPNFKVCNYPKVYQYYNFGDGFDYEAEKTTIIEELEKLNLYDPTKKSGYITIRFVVNCEGKTGWFRLTEMDSNYQETKFDSKFSQSLLDFTKNLKGWKTKIAKEKNVDYYQYLTFKIKDGKVSEILP